MENGLPSRTPSGLFPGAPNRPVYREPHPIRFAGVLSGLAVTFVWLLLGGLLAAANARAFAWILLIASLLAWLAALGLARFGDRGVAVGVGLGACAGVTVVGILLIVRWATVGWLLW